MLKKLWLTAALSLTLTACATGPQLAPAGKFETPAYSVDLLSDWNALPVRTDKNKKATVLTKDGTRLNAVYLFSDVMPGDALYNQVRRDNPVPKFDPDMSDLEMVELVTSSLERGARIKSLKTQNVRPDSFNGRDAIRFDMTGTTGAGLDVEGSALLANIDGKFNLVMFVAPSEYYAEKYRRDVDAIFGSVGDGDILG